MRFHVNADGTVRTVEIEIAGVPDLDVSRSYHDATRPPRVIRPDRVVLTFTDGLLAQISVSGPLVMKDGALSARRETEAWWIEPGMPIVRLVRSVSQTSQRDPTVRDGVRHAPSWVHHLASRDW